MLVHFRQLGPSSEAERLKLMTDAAQEFFVALSKEQEARAAEALQRVDPRLRFFKQLAQSGTFVLLRWEELPAYPAAQLVKCLAPADVQVQLGRAPLGHEAALELALRDEGIDLSEARVRVGVSRGHLLEIVVSVPLHVQGTEEQLQVAAEVYLEASAGDERLDRWVGDISVDRIARTRGLVTLQGRDDRAVSHPLSFASTLIETGIQGIEAALPESLLSEAEGRNEAREWTALSIPEMSAGLQAGRTFASTRFPEALKAALEGLPFASARFTRGPEVMMWFCWKAASSAERVPLREKVEAQLLDLKDEVPLSLAGTGFGARHDYLDLWVLPEPAMIRTVVDVLLSVVESIEGGFYDAHWAEEILEVSVGDFLS